MIGNDKIMFDDIFSNKLDKSVIREYLIKLNKKGENANEIYSAAFAMRNHLIPLKVDDELLDELIDNCGTGGDKSNSFNISTTVSLLLASCGSKVAKHGNRSITSKSGSADVLEALGINLDISLQNQVKMLEQTGFVFMFAPNHNPVMKSLMPVRKSIPHRTIFNLLGPLINPAGVRKQLIGVYDKQYVNIIAQALVMLNTKRAIVVSSADGMDEISISDVTYAAFINNAKIEEFIIDPREYGFELYNKEDIIGGDALFNAKITKDILSGVQKGAKLDIVIINTAVALFVDNKVKSIQDGIILAKEVIKSKKALKKLDSIIALSNKFKN